MPADTGRQSRLGLRDFVGQEMGERIDRLILLAARAFDASSGVVDGEGVHSPIAFKAAAVRRDWSARRMW